MPSLSSLVVATRPVGAFETSRCLGGFVVVEAVVATREVGADGATFVRLGRGILIVYDEVAFVGYFEGRVQCLGPGRMFVMVCGVVASMVHVRRIIETTSRACT